MGCWQEQNLSCGGGSWWFDKGRVGFMFVVDGISCSFVFIDWVWWCCSLPLWEVGCSTTIANQQASKQVILVMCWVECKDLCSLLKHGWVGAMFCSMILNCFCLWLQEVKNCRFWVWDDDLKKWLNQDSENNGGVGSNVGCRSNVDLNHLLSHKWRS